MENDSIKFEDLNATQKNKLIDIMLNKHRHSSNVLNSNKENNHIKQGPVTLVQEALWFLEQLEGPGSVYNIPIALQIKGKLDIGILEKSFNHLINAHSALRTSIFKENENVFQKISENVNITLPVISVKEEDLSTVVDNEIHKPFLLTESPLMRGALFKLSEINFIFILTIHHIVSDSWSIHILLRDLSIAYTSMKNMRNVKLPISSMQYIEYAAWQRSWLSEDKINQQLVYWRNQLQDMPSLFDLPTDYARPQVQSFRGNQYKYLIKPDLTNQIDNLCKTYHVTPYIFLLAAFVVLLHRLSGQKDIFIGTPIGNRARSEFENVVGYFVNMLIMRNFVDSKKDFFTLLNIVKKNAFDAYEHQDIPFNFLVKELMPIRDLSYNSLVQVEFILQNSPAISLELDELQINEFDIKSTVAKFDLSFSLTKINNYYEGIIEYNTDLFSRSTINCFERCYQQIIESVLKDIKKPIYAIDLLDQAYKELLLYKWPFSGKDCQLKDTFITLFERNTNEFLNKIAVVHNNDFMTYQQVRERASEIAMALIQFGIHKGDRVILFLDRSIDYLCSLIACLKLGAVFVPLNPDLARDWNHTIIEHAKPVCCIVKSRLKTELDDNITSSILDLDELNLANQVESYVRCIGDGVSLDDIAYIIYTSGSTGQPKGAMITNRGMVNHLLAKVCDFNLSPNDKVAQIAVQTFDVSIWQMLVALLVGGQTVIMTDENAWVPSNLLTQIDENKITTLETVPSHLQIIFNELKRHYKQYNLGSLRLLISNGEPLTKELCELKSELLPKCMFVNAYGPTECSDDVTHFIITNSFLRAKSNFIPLGKPISNTFLYILDDNLMPVPIGIAGELYIGGDCVGAGYFNDAEKTIEKFVQNPFSSDPESKLFRTGDKVKYHPDGNIEFIGRIDFLLKIRGMRVDYKHVEAVLDQHQEISKSLVISSADSMNNNYLIAYVIAKKKPSPSTNVIKNYCKDKLPDYMVPAEIILLDEFPLLINGKIDRFSLPKPYQNQPVSPTGGLAPKTKLEIQIAGVWSEVLKVKSICVDDNFFQLGGHSLLAVEAITKMEVIFNKKIPIKTIFGHPTIAMLIPAILALE